MRSCEEDNSGYGVGDMLVLIVKLAEEVGLRANYSRPCNQRATYLFHNETTH